jgi:transposase
MDRDQRFPKTWKEARRKRAVELRQQGWKQKDIAEAFAVSAAAVSQWLAKAREDGVAAWRAKPRPKGPIKLTEAQLRSIPELLSHGAEAYGFRGEMWTCARVAAALTGTAQGHSSGSRWRRDTVLAQLPRAGGGRNFNRCLVRDRCWSRNRIAELKQRLSTGRTCTRGRAKQCLTFAPREAYAS